VLVALYWHLPRLPPALSPCVDSALQIEVAIRRVCVVIVLFVLSPVQVCVYDLAILSRQVLYVCLCLVKTYCQLLSIFLFLFKDMALFVYDWLRIYTRLACSNYPST